MTAIPWPSAHLPGPRRVGHTAGPVDERDKTDMPGVPAIHARSTAARTDLQWQWLFTAGQFHIFEAWYARILGNGARWFSISPTGETTHELRFAKPYRAEPISSSAWVVAAQLEERERAGV